MNKTGGQTLSTRTQSHSRKVLICSMIVLFAVHVVGCTTLVSVPMDTSRLDDEKVLYLELSSGETIKVKEARLEDGFLAGITPKYNSLSGHFEQIKIPLSQISLIKVERHSSEKTIIAGSIIALMVGMLYFYASQYRDGFN